MKYKLFFLAISMLLLISKSKSQTLETNCEHYPYNTLVGINLNMNLHSKMGIQQNYYIRSSHSDYLQSYPSFGADLGVYLYQRIYKWFGIQVGAEYSATTICYGEIANLGTFQSKSMDYYAAGAFTFPILFNASYYFNGKHGMDICLGGAPFVLFVGEAGQGVWLGDRKGGNYCRFRLDYDIPFNFSLYGKIGYNFLFKNKNTFGVSIIGSYAAKPYAQGKYFVVVNEIEVEAGYTSLRNTFIGLQFSYGFTMKKLLCVP